MTTRVNPKTRPGRGAAPRCLPGRADLINEDRFVRDVVVRRLGPAELARKHKRSLEAIEAILAGRKYRRIAKRIELALACERQRTRWRLAALQADAVAALENAVRSQPGSASLSAAKEILNLALDIDKASAATKTARTKLAPASKRGRRRSLPHEDKRRVLAELGGPTPR